MNDWVKEIRERLADPKKGEYGADSTAIKNYFELHAFAKRDLINLLEEREVLREALNQYSKLEPLPCDCYDVQRCPHLFKKFPNVAMKALFWKPRKNE